MDGAWAPAATTSPPSEGETGGLDGDRKAGGDSGKVGSVERDGLERLMVSIAQREQEELEVELKEWDQQMGLRRMTVKELRVIARERSVAGRSKMRKAELIAAIEAGGSLRVPE
jgi:hypothetical protein